MCTINTTRIKYFLAHQPSSLILEKLSSHFSRNSFFATRVSWRMATPLDETKFFKPFLPPLQICASAKIGVQLRQIFGLEALLAAFREILQGDLTTAEGSNDRIRRAKEGLLDIPAHLREGVMDAAVGSYPTVVYWKKYYRVHFELRDAESSFRFRSDGTVDALKTAKGLIRSEKLDIRQRFKLACVFCHVKSVKTLWAEMVASGQTKDVETSDEFIVKVWVGWLHKRTPSPPLALIELDNPRFKCPRCSVFFSFLRSEDRMEFSLLLYKTPWDDVRFCFHLFTRKEEEQLLKEGMAFILLRPLLLWPLQNMFLPTVARLWEYMDEISFRELLDAILLLTDKLTDFNYSQLFEEFWNATPLHLKESALGEPELRQKIDSFFDKKKGKETTLKTEGSQNI